MQKYIAFEAPIIVHFNLSSIGNFIKDKRYKNIFETSTSGGALSKEMRRKWENFLFGSCYDDAKGKDRVKYGVMNFMNDHRGLKSCSQYGESYFVLKQHVRPRCTITNKRKYE